jgi:hypothetical protein
MRSDLKTFGKKIMAKRNKEKIIQKTLPEFYAGMLHNYRS